MIEGFKRGLPVNMAGIYSTIMTRGHGIGNFVSIFVRYKFITRVLRIAFNAARSSSCSIVLLSECVSPDKFRFK